MNKKYLLKDFTAGFVLANLVLYPQAFAYISGNCAGSYEACHYTLDEEGTLIISGNGGINNFTFYSGYLPTGAAVKSIIIEEGITSIGSGAFLGQRELTSVFIPNSVTSIAGQVFRDTGAEKKLYCSATQRADGGVCSSSSLGNAWYSGTIIPYEKDGDNYIVYDGDGAITGIYSSVENIYKDTVVDFHTSNKKGIVTEYDGRGNVNSTSRYDAGGNLIAKYDKNGISAYKRTSYTPAEAAAAIKKGDNNKITLAFK